MLFLVIVFYENGLIPVGVFSTIEQAKAATEIACSATVPDDYGAVVNGAVHEMELDRLYAGEEKVGVHEMFPGGFNLN